MERVAPLPLNVIDSSKVVTTASTQCLGSKVNRYYVFFSNSSTIDIWVSLGTVTATVGGLGSHKIVANGGSLVFESGVVPQNSFNAIAASGTPNLTIWEV
jgi:hypothetical protein